VTVAGLALAGCAEKENTGTGGGQAPPQTAGWPETEEVKLVDGKKGGTFRLGITEPTAIDPYNAQESEGIFVASYLFTGLVKAEPDGSTKPGVAEKWAPNDDCSEWTFTLKKGTKFHNGEEVTAQSFKTAWERAAIKAAASEVSYHMEPIAGYKDINEGSATTMSGVTVADPATLKVKLDSPDCEFYLRTIHPVFSPVPSTAGAADNKTYNDAPVGNGPFMMDGVWEHDKGIKLKRFDGYGADKPAYLDAVEITITAGGAKDEHAGFNNGSFDWARMPTPVLSDERAKHESDGKWIRKNTNGMNYLLTMDTTKPLDSAKARKAISMAIDRDAIINGVFKGSQTPSTSLVPPVFKSAYQPGVCTACKYNLEEAKKLAGEAGLTQGTELNFQFNTDAGHEEWCAAVKQQLEQNLGLKVNMTGVEFKDLLDNEQQPGASGIYRAAWGADYPTPGNFLAPLLSTEAIGAGPTEPTTGDNRGRYSNPKFDELLKKANASKDDSERIKFYQDAEKIAIGEDLALIPLWNRTQNRLANAEKFVNLRMDFNEFADISVISIK
jgi:oligopeptide transport system substrate-binding protein